MWTQTQTGRARPFLAGGALAVFVCLALAGCRAWAPAAAPRDGGAAVEAGPSPEALALYGRGFLCELEGRPDEALPLYLRALERDPDYAKLYVRVAALYVQKKDGAAALKVLDRLVQRQPGSASPWRWIARVHAVEGRPEPALEAFRRALAADPGDAESASDLAQYLLEQQRAPEALAALRAQTERVREPARLLRVAGALYCADDAGATNAAARAAAGKLLGELARRTAKDAPARTVLATIYLAANEPDRALAAYRDALRLKPDDARIYLAAARLHLAQDKADEAIRLLEEGLGKVSHPMSLRRALGPLYARRAARPGTKPDGARADRARAIRCLETVVGETPGDTRARIELGDVYIADGRTAAAVGALGPVFLDDAGLRARLSARFLSAGKPEELIEKFRALPARGPESRLVDYCLGEFLARRGGLAEARAAFERAAAAEPPEASPYVRLAMLDADRPLEKSVAALQRGLDRLPGDPSLLAARAIVEMLRRQFDAALRTCDELDRAIRNDGAASPPPALQIHRALVLQYRGETGRAVESLAALMEAEPLSLEVFVDRAFEFDRRLDTRAATRATLRRLAERRPGDPLVPMFTGLYEQSAEAYPAAVAAFQEAEKRGRLRPEDGKFLTPRFWFWYGSALERTGRIGEAEPLILKCIQAEPDFPEPYNYLAYTWAEKGLQLDRAAKFIGIALAREPDNGAYLDTRGWVAFQQGRYAAALADLERAVEKTGEDATVLDHLGDTLAKLGRLPDALPRWSRSLVLDPKNAQVQTKLLQHGVDLAPLLQEGKELQEKKLLDLGPLLGIGGAGAEAGGDEEGSDEEEPAGTGDEMNPDDPMPPSGTGAPLP